MVSYLVLTYSQAAALIMVRQVALLPAGCQPWNQQVVATNSTGQMFAYSATLAIYIYKVSC